jgi:hypothetical protein
VTTPAMAVNAAARVDSHTPTTPTDDGEYRAEESVGTPSSSLKSPAANDDFSFDLSFSGKPSSDSSDAGDVIDGDALALEAAANASAAMAPAALRATCLLTCTVGMYRLNALDPELESAWFQPLSLSSEKLVSKFGFSNANLYRYSAALLSGDVIAFLSLAPALSSHSLPLPLRQSRASSTLRTSSTRPRWPPPSAPSRRGLYKPNPALPIARKRLVSTLEPIK